MLLTVLEWLAFCIPNLVALEKRIDVLHTRLTLTNLTEADRYNASWELARAMYGRYRLLNA